MSAEQVWEAHNRFKQVPLRGRESGAMAGKCKCGRMLIGVTHLQHLLAEFEAASVEREKRAWGDGYDTAEADYRGTGFWARGLRMNPFGKEDREG